MGVCCENEVNEVKMDRGDLVPKKIRKLQASSVKFHDEQGNMQQYEEEPENEPNLLRNKKKKEKVEEDEDVYIAPAGLKRRNTIKEEDLEVIEGLNHLRIKVPETVILHSLHPYALKYIEDMAAANDGDAEWCCNGVEIFKDGCKSGQRDFGNHLLSRCWRSTGADADFDMCETCVQWVLYCQTTNTNMDIGNLKELEQSGVNVLRTGDVHSSTVETLNRLSVVSNHT